MPPSEDFVRCELMDSCSFFVPADRHQFPRNYWSARIASGELSFLRVAKSSTSSFARRLTSLKSRRAFFELEFHLPVPAAAKKPRSCRRDWARRISSSVDDSSWGIVGTVASGSGAGVEDSALASLAVTIGCSAAG